MRARHRTAALAFRAIGVLAAAAAATAARAQTPAPPTESPFQLAFGFGAGFSAISRSPDGPNTLPEAVLMADGRVSVGPIVAGATLEGGWYVLWANLLLGGYAGVRIPIGGDRVLVSALQGGAHVFSRSEFGDTSTETVASGTLPFAGLRLGLERSDALGPHRAGLWLSLAQDLGRVSVPATPTPYETSTRYGGTVLLAGVSFRVGTRW